ncbi:DNA alkylation repair protein [Sulfurimonas sp.]|uniref:DNA alkylation repair protein n=1 Tax=Sulfurimonas sp. TaxID=2022749 RepID=UPI002AAFB2D0|nr:DNA alkylation repair protein [Sulfurimonas sp.]
MAELLKNIYNKSYLEILSSELTLVYGDFNKESFFKSIFNYEWDTKELKERMRHISTTLGLFLPKDYERAIEILKKSFLQLNHAYRLENMIFQDFVEVYGLENFEISIDAMEFFTIESSSEFAIRKFILKYQDATIAQMLIWAKSDNFHVRRLASEGCRPRLPWAIALPKFKKEPFEVLQILDILKDDESEYVRKSVANNINDISKDNPQVVKKLASKWIGVNSNRDALLKHGCRTLLKSSDKEILNLFGFKSPDAVILGEFKLSKELKMGEELEFSFILNSQNNLGKLRIEYILEFIRKNKKHNAKVFKISEGIFEKNEKKVFKKHSFKPISTRVYYKGLHKLSIVINGEIFAKEEFFLT